VNVFFREIIFVYSTNYMNAIDTGCGQKAESTNVKSRRYVTSPVCFKDLQQTMITSCKILSLFLIDNEANKCRSWHWALFGHHFVWFVLLKCCELCKLLFRVADVSTCCFSHSQWLGRWIFERRTTPMRSTLYWPLSNMKQRTVASNGFICSSPVAYYYFCTDPKQNSKPMGNI
jgi:hypothetical protein